MSESGECQQIVININEQKFVNNVVNQTAQGENVQRQGQFSSICASVACIEELTLEEKKNVAINTLLQMAECYAKLGKDGEAKKTIEALKSLLMSSRSGVYDVIKFAADLIAYKSYFRALVLLRVLSDIYLQDPSLSPDDVVQRIFECAIETYRVVKAMIESGVELKVIAQNYGIPFISNMRDNLHAVKNADSLIKAIDEASCFEMIGLSYHSVAEYQKCIEFRARGVSVMERHFDKNAAKPKIYGVLLNNMGAAYNHLSKTSDAKKCFEDAHRALTTATDYSNEDEKQYFTEEVQDNLKFHSGTK